MNFLKKLGTVVLKIIGVYNVFVPLVNQVAGPNATMTKYEDKISQAFGVIVTVEQTFAAAFGPDAKKGSDKLKAAVPFVAQLIQQTTLLAGKHPKNEALFTDAATRLTAAMADILNSYEG